MEFDQSTRNRLQKFVNDARDLLVKEFTRIMQYEYGMDPVTGEVSDLDSLSHLDDNRRQIARLLRDTLDHYLAGSLSNGNQECLERIVREQAFTVLNRLCALRMAEARAILIESIGRGYKSQGFQLYARLAGGALGETGEAYRCYLFSVFDELTLDLAVLFDRFSPYGCLFPGESVLLELLDLINHHELALLWAEDETIGWIYQYFNSPEERRQMRAESQAPRNSRELAVRNQFFTPRYVVEFLTDNTVGRIWYEMTRGNTVLKNQCRYLVRRSNEIFLKKGEETPEQNNPAENLSQEDLLKQPVYISYRQLKDPRNIRMLDPACGSMHFGLYAFDLFEKIYEEAWELEGQLDAGVFQRSAEFRPLQQTYNSKEELMRDVPRLIIEHNIYGIDIDQRAVQIAGLSLWLRAQRSWLTQGIKPQDRPQIVRSNVVCAEPMPGDKELLREFTQDLKPRVLGQLVEVIFDKMQLAGEAGSLLKIEEEIEEAVAAAREEFSEELTRRREGEQSFLFPELSPSRQATLFDFTDLPDRTRFWNDAEQRILNALHKYAEQAEAMQANKKRLFAQDAARGFAFIDICRKRYDVVLMNPPFGEPSEKGLDYITSCYENINKNLLCAFLQRAYHIGSLCSFTGAIYDRTAIIKNSYEKFRRDFLLPNSQLFAQLDLGWDVLDANVEVTSSVFKYSPEHQVCVFVDVRGVNPSEKGEIVAHEIAELSKARVGDYRLCTAMAFDSFPNAVLGYDFPTYALRAFLNLGSFEDEVGPVIAGHTIKSDRFFRSWWEVPLENAFMPEAAWQRLYNGGAYNRFVSPFYHAVYYGIAGEKVQSHSSTILRNLSLQQQGNVGFGKRGDFVDAHALPSGFVSSVEGQAIIVKPDVSPFVALAIINSRMFQAIINYYCGQHKYPGYVNIFPSPSCTNPSLKEAAKIVEEIFKIKDLLQAGEEISPKFGMKGSVPIWDYRAFEEITPKVKQVTNLESNMNTLMCSAYSLSEEEISLVNRRCENEPSTGYWFDNGLDTAGAKACLSYYVGICFGRWDIRHATSDTPPPELSDPFAPLPVCPPSMLQNANGLPAQAQDLPPNYPIRVSWTGILADDESRQEDLVRRMNEAMQVIWGEKAVDVEQEVCDILGARSLREYFRKSGSFFVDHLTRYSRGGRKAPIYWPLSTESGSYTLWLYYHRLTDQTLYICINDFVEPKLKEVADITSRLYQKPHRNSAEEKELENLSEFELELKDFRTELLRVAAFWKPNLNDGVQITAAPLWKLFRYNPWQRTLKGTWQKLKRGDYDWAHLAYSIWPDRVKQKCKNDKSLAIAHCLEELYGQ